jgi:hypothetical protein
VRVHEAKVGLHIRYRTLPFASVADITRCCFDRPTQHVCPTGVRCTATGGRTHRAPTASATRLHSRQPRRQAKRNIRQANTNIAMIYRPCLRSCSSQCRDTGRVTVALSRPATRSGWRDQRQRPNDASLHQSKTSQPRATCVTVAEEPTHPYCTVSRAQTAHNTTPTTRRRGPPQPTRVLDAISADDHNFTLIKVEELRLTIPEVHDRPHNLLDCAPALSAQGGPVLGQMHCTQNFNDCSMRIFP